MTPLGARNIGEGVTEGGHVIPFNAALVSMHKSPSLSISMARLRANGLFYLYHKDSGVQQPGLAAPPKRASAGPYWECTPTQWQDIVLCDEQT